MIIDNELMNKSKYSRKKDIPASTELIHSNEKINPRRARYTVNFKRIEKYLDQGYKYGQFILLYRKNPISFIFRLSKFQSSQSRTVSRKNQTGNAAIVYDTMLDMSIFCDKETFILVNCRYIGQETIEFEMNSVWQPGIVYDVPEITICAPHQTGRWQELAWDRHENKSNKTDYEIYRSKVSQNSNYSKNICENVVKTDVNYHLDHIFSIKEGYDLKIPPEIIGHFVNLRYISDKDNMSKGSRSDMSYHDLISKYIAVVGLEKYNQVNLDYLQKFK